MREGEIKVPVILPVVAHKKVGIKLPSIKVGAPVRLEPEPDNPVDPLAVRVVAPDGYPLGYLPRFITSRIRPERFEAHVEMVLYRRGRRAPAGLRVKLTPRRDNGLGVIPLT